MARTGRQVQNEVTKKVRLGLIPPRASLSGLISPTKKIENKLSIPCQGTNCLTGLSLLVKLSRSILGPGSFPEELREDCSGQSPALE